jgi:hypothetical protein
LFLNHPPPALNIFKRTLFSLDYPACTAGRQVGSLFVCYKIRHQFPAYRQAGVTFINKKIPQNIDLAGFSV